jgi:hypothetical protein
MEWFMREGEKSEASRKLHVNTVDRIRGANYQRVKGARMSREVKDGEKANEGKRGKEDEGCKGHDGGRGVREACGRVSGNEPREAE